MTDYTSKTKTLIKEITQDLCTEKDLFVREIDIKWSPEHKDDGNKVTIELTPRVNIKFWE